ncbi:gamma-glutamyl-gamma-aminobutyrate hydrolase family protein [Propionivibrio sp.]|uniref:gamma-glutamyl-gamma-aminobutyrate hydrolase family protein n=1 Tax=Propionivibrio sp. TaxID=2212460 RepID=UPI00261134C4|nr:gamma-glutamyl-gamma-aminobutyrate hydrolase family protein [Propionivibrio sp.]
MIISPNCKIVVGITQRIDSVPGRTELRDALDQRLAQWLLHSGFLPVAVPNTLAVTEDADKPTLEDWVRAIQPNALILSGGNDIGEHPTRDATERYLLSWAEAKWIPVLGVCRGLQMMAVWAGTNLVKKGGHVGSRHQLVIPARKDDWPANVNSFHNWGLASCPKGFEVAAQAEDNSIEAIKHSQLPWEGWMWHPEREMPFSLQDIKRLKRLFNGQ